MPAQVSTDVDAIPLPCPFCGKPVDLKNTDTLHLTGVGWLFNEELQTHTYHRNTETPQEQWCYSMNCPVTAGGCGATMHGDTKADALAKWNKRATPI